jgi:type II secretory pathway component PulF
MPASYRDRAVYYRSLSTLLAAGAPAGIALKAAADGVRSRVLRHAASDAAYRAGAGLGVAESLAHHPDVFEESDVALLQSLERIGELDRGLLRLAEDADAADAIGRRLRAGLAYPVVLYHAAAVIPPIRFLVLEGFSAWFVRVLVLLLPFYGFLLLLLWLGRSTSGRVLRTRILRRIPWIGHAVRRAALARFLRVLAGGHDAGLSAVETATAACSATTDPDLRAVARSGIELLAAGNPWVRFFALVPGLGEHDAMNLTTAETTGSLATALRGLAVIQEERAKEASQAALRWIPLIVYLLIAGYIAFTVISMWMGYLSQLRSF